MKLSFVNTFTRAYLSFVSLILSIILAACSTQHEIENFAKSGRTKNLTEFFATRSPAQVSESHSVLEANATPKRQISEIHSQAQPENVKKLSQAKVVMADYDLIRKDFPSLAQSSNVEIDNWLIDNAAYMSESQVTSTTTNTPIPVTQDPASINNAFRPPEYGRALVFQARDPSDKNKTIGMLDAKGVGAKSPKPWGHADGLATLGEGIREFVYEKLVRRIFWHENLGLKTVGTYAVIDAGFDGVHENGDKSPAGIIVRQAHTRFRGNYPYSLFDDDHSLFVENTLRRYGITSAGAYRSPQSLDRINVQGTREGAVIDFGAFLTVEKFTQRAQHFYGGVDLINPQSPTAVQPDPQVRIPLEIWGTTESGVEDPKNDNLWRWSHELASNWRRGVADRQAFQTHLNNMLGPAEARIATEARKFPSACSSRLLRFLVKIR